MDTIIALKDAHIDNSTLPLNKQERFTKNSNEIFIYNNSESLTSNSLNEHYLIVEEDDYIQWIGHMQKMAFVEKEAIKFKALLSKTQNNNIINQKKVDIKQQLVYLV